MKTSLAQELITAPVSSLVPDELHVEDSEYQEDADTIEVLEVPEEDPEIQIMVMDTDLPGAPPGTILEEPEVSKEDEKKNDKKNEDAEWDWESHGLENFVQWAKDRRANVTKHSGTEYAGCARAESYLERLDKAIINAMRADFKGKIDHHEIKQIRDELHSGLSGLKRRMKELDRHQEAKKSASFESSEFIKNAQKITGVKGVYVTVPLLISRIARVCINGHVSAGHSLKDLYTKQVKAYSLSKREQAEVKQLIADMGMPIWEDRGLMPDEDLDISSTDNFDFSAQYNS